MKSWQKHVYKDKYDGATGAFGDTKGFMCSNVAAHEAFEVLSPVVRHKDNDREQYVVQPGSQLECVLYWSA